MGALAGVVYLADQVGEVFRVGHEVDVRGVHDQQRRLVVVKEKIAIRGRDALQVLEADVTLEIAVALA